MGVSTLIHTWHGDGGGPFHTPSPTLATNNIIKESFSSIKCVNDLSFSSFIFVN